MERLIAFFYNNYNLLLFVGLEAVALWMLVRFNDQHNRSYSSWSTAVGGRVQEVNASITTYFRLGEANEELLAQNIILRRSLIEKELKLNAYSAAALDSNSSVNLMPDSLLPADRYIDLPARVLSNSVRSRLNYLLIDKGRKHGVKPEMGIVSASGIAGQVISVAEHYSLAMSVLNTDINISSRIKGKKIIGTIGWDGDDSRYVQLRYVPQHYPVEPGDSVMTSGFSSIFPEGFFIGRVLDVHKDNPEGFSTIRVRLATDFHTLDYVYLVRMERAPEIDSLLNFGR